MVSIVIRNDAEPTVIDLTIENMDKEIRGIDGAEIIVEEDWKKGIKRSINTFVSLVEADCLVNSGYYSSMVGLFNKNPNYRQLVMMCSAIGINSWEDRFFGYEVEKSWSEEVSLYGASLRTSSWKLAPVRTSRSKSPYPVQVGYVPGALIRRGALWDIVRRSSILSGRDLARMSFEFCNRLWDSERNISLNPNTTYVTTEGVDYEMRSTHVSQRLQIATERGAA